MNNENKEPDGRLKLPVFYTISDPNRFAFATYYDAGGNYISPEQIIAALNARQLKEFDAKIPADADALIINFAHSVLGIGDDLGKQIALLRFIDDYKVKPAEPKPDDDLNELEYMDELRRLSAEKKPKAIDPDECPRLTFLAEVLNITESDYKTDGELWGMLAECYDRNFPEQPKAVDAVIEATALAFADGLAELTYCPCNQKECPQCTAFKFGATLGYRSGFAASHKELQARLAEVGNLIESIDYIPNKTCEDCRCVTEMIRVYRAKHPKQPQGDSEGV